MTTTHVQVIGLDLSLTSTGVAVINHNNLFGTTAAVARVTTRRPEDATPHADREAHPAHAGTAPSAVAANRP